MHLREDRTYALWLSHNLTFRTAQISTVSHVGPDDREDPPLLRPRFAQTARLLEDAAEDIPAYRHLPLEHQRRGRRQ